MTLIKFVRTPTLKKAIERGPLMVAMLRETAGDVEREAKQIARAEAYDEGDYHDGIEGTAGVDALGGVGRVNANDFKSAWIEFGVSGRPGVHTLFRALQKVLIRAIPLRKRGG